MRKSATNRPDNINHKLIKTIELAQVFQASLFREALCNQGLTLAALSNFQDE
jgi:hypothetical protein